MNALNEIMSLSREEKLKVMEALWEDLSHDEEKVVSPDWHRDALHETEKLFANGNEYSVDWSDAKKVSSVTQNDPGSAIKMTPLPR